MSKIGIDEVKRIDLPYLAETIVLAELSKRGIYSVRLPPQFDYDIICTNDARIEVKSSSLQRTRKGVWTFSNTRIRRKFKKGIIESITQEKRTRHCDYYTFVGYDEERIPHIFIIPNELVGDKSSFRINPVKGSKYWEYYNNWELIINHESKI